MKHKPNPLKVVFQRFLNLTLWEMAGSHNKTNLAASDDSVPFGGNGSPSSFSDQGGGVIFYVVN